MNWIDLLLLAAFVIGLGAGGFLVARSPTFWVGMIMVILKRSWPYILKYLAPQVPQNQEELDAVRRRAEEWDNLNKKERESPK